MLWVLGSYKVFIERQVFIGHLVYRVVTLLTLNAAKLAKLIYRLNKRHVVITNICTPRFSPRRVYGLIDKARLCCNKEVSARYPLTELPCLYSYLSISAASSARASVQRLQNANDHGMLHQLRATMSVWFCVCACLNANTLFEFTINGSLFTISGTPSHQQCIRGKHEPSLGSSAKMHFCLSSYSQMDL